MKLHRRLLAGLLMILTIGASPLFGGASAGAEDQQGAAAEGSSEALWAKAQGMFAQNDFAQASAAAEHVTSSTLKPKAQAMISHIHAYVAALQDGVAAENRHDPVAAIQSYAAAVGIKKDGPGDPAGRIIRVQALAASAAEQARQSKVLQARHDLLLAQAKSKAAQLTKQGLGQEREGNNKDALASFQAAQATSPGSPGVPEAIKRLQEKLKSPQVTLSPEPGAGPAIRDFYAGQYDKAEGELNAITFTPNARQLGAIYFYLGAARLERALLGAGQSPADAARQPEVRGAFHQAHSLGYVPLKKFVSPVIMSAWQSTL
ncbi:MAG: hypothetical protein ACRYFU_12190 [Janthinobacterium lividum]